MLVDEKDTASHGLLCKIAHRSIVHRPGEIRLVKKVEDRNGGIEYSCSKWYTFLDAEFWTIVDSKFAGGVWWYKLVSSTGIIGWTDQGHRLESEIES